MTPPMPMHPIMRPETVPRSAIQTTSDNATGIIRYCDPALRGGALHDAGAVSAAPERFCFRHGGRERIRGARLVALICARPCSAADLRHSGSAPTF
jgi:hypothetical protein